MQKDYWVPQFEKDDEIRSSIIQTFNRLQSLSIFGRSFDYGFEMKVKCSPKSRFVKSANHRFANLVFTCFDDVSLEAFMHQPATVALRAFDDHLTLKITPALDQDWAPSYSPPDLHVFRGYNKASKVKVTMVLRKTHNLPLTRGYKNANDSLTRLAHGKTVDWLRLV